MSSRLTVTTLRFRVGAFRGVESAAFFGEAAAFPDLVAALGAFSAFFFEEAFFVFEAVLGTFSGLVSLGMSGMFF